MINLRKLRGLRVENNLSQEKMAKLLDISVSTYQRKESGETEFTLNEAYCISKIVNRPLEGIFFTKQYPKWDKREDANDYTVSTPE